MEKQVEVDWDSGSIETGDLGVVLWSLFQNPDHKWAGGGIEIGARIVAIQGSNLQTGAVGERCELGGGSEAEGERQQAALEHQASLVVDLEELVTRR